MYNITLFNRIIFGLNNLERFSKYDIFPYRSEFGRKTKVKIKPNVGAVETKDPGFFY